MWHQEHRQQKREVGEWGVTELDTCSSEDSKAFMSHMIEKLAVAYLTRLDYIQVLTIQ